MNWWLGVIGSVLFAGAAQAETVAASTMRYKNNAEYQANFYVRYNINNGQKCAVFPKGLSNSILAGRWVRVALTDEMRQYDGPANCLERGLYIPTGTEVWGKVNILTGDSKSCRKSKKVVFKYTGGEIKYSTGGTTLQNNRCKVRKWP